MCLRADYFEIVRAAHGRECGWVALYDDRTGDPHPAAVRADRDTGTGAAYCAPYCHEDELSGIAGLIR